MTEPKKFTDTLRDALAKKHAAAHPDAKTGKKFWTERMGKAHHASLVHVDGHILVFDEEGICHILVDGPEFKLLRRNRLGDSCHATPAIAGSTLVVRTGKALWRIGEKTR